MLHKRLKFRHTFLYHVVLFAMLFNFIGYPAYAMIEYYPYYAAKYPPTFSFFDTDEFLSKELSVIEKPETTAEQNQNTIYTTTAQTITTQSTANKEIVEIHSADKQGIIGYDENHTSDDPYDNLFSFTVDKNLLNNKEIRLSYDVFGIDNPSGISRSINENNAVGGYIIQKNNQWKTVEEVLVPEQLKSGLNHIMFTVPEHENIRYKVKNLKITLSPETNKQPVYFTDAHTLYFKGNTSYIKGTVSDKDAVLSINGQPISVVNHEFETLLEDTGSVNELEVILKNSSGETLYAQTHPIEHKIDATHQIVYKKPAALQKIVRTSDEVYAFTTDAMDFQINLQDYKDARYITAQKLRSVDIAPLGTNIINVTQDAAAYRFLPEGARFAQKAKLALHYNTALLPKGYSEKDIQILYFDLQQRRWLAVETDSIDTEHQKIISLTDHFTDYIAGIIQAPDSPETNSYTPTSISDIKIADPTANTMQIQPPVANQKGDGTLDFPIQLPSGRNGLQPSVAVSYNNNGSSGIAGFGWDISMAFITVDTKFGVPEYHASKETESYLLNGEELQLKNGTQLYLPHRSFTTINRVNNAVFYPKTESSFSKIERKGTHPSNYYWVVSDKSGTKYYYGQTASGRLTSGTNSGNIAKWMLEKVEDKNGNYIQYNYYTKTYNSGILSGGKELLINSISYTLHPSINYSGMEKGIHKVNFIYNTEQRTDQSVSYRYGFKEVSASSVNSIQVFSATQRKKDVENYQIHYNFKYKTGAFGKQLLDGIETNNIKIHKDQSQETTSYVHTFEYYNDVQNGLFGPDVRLNSYDDFEDEKHSTLSSGKESYKTSEFTVGGGVSPLYNVPSWWPFSTGGTFNMTFPSNVSSKTSPAMVLMDIDGDGLDDKVMKIGNDVKYRKNLGGVLFSEQLYKVSHLPELGLTENRSSTAPEKSISLIAFNLQSSKSNSNSRVRTFFTDVNSDGLVDYVKDKIVYFNRIDPNSGLPSFTSNSELTPNLIFKEGDVDPGISEPLPDLTLGNDLMDVVKVWVAPKAGKINITGQISKPFVASENGVRYSVEKSSFKNLVVGPPVNLGSYYAALSQTTEDTFNSFLLVNEEVNQTDSQFFNPALSETVENTWMSDLLVNEHVNQADSLFVNPAISGLTADVPVAWPIDDSEAYDLPYEQDFTDLLDSMGTPMMAEPFNTMAANALPVIPGGPIGGSPLIPYTTTYIKQPSLLVVNSETTNFSNISVSKGDMIFFRVNSSQIPTEPAAVTWDPAITYTTQDYPSANQYPQYSSRFSESFVYGNAISEPHLFTAKGNYRLQWDAFTINNSGTNAQLSDDVFITVTGYQLKTNPDNSVSKVPFNGYSSTQLQKRHIKANTNNAIPAINLAFNFTDINSNDPDTYKYLEIEVETTSQINWKLLDNLFKPRVIKTDNNELTYIKPKYQSYHKQHNNNYKSTFPTATTLGINHNFSLAGCDEPTCKDRTIFMVVKNANGKIISTLNGRPAKFRYLINQNGVITEKRQFNGTTFVTLTGNSYQASLPANTTLFIEYYTDSGTIATKLNAFQNTNGNNLVTATSATTNTSFYKPNIFYSDEMNGFGTLFRNWGVFAYKGAQPEENFVPIKRSYLGRLAIAGLSSAETPTQTEINQMNNLANTNIEDIDYDFDTDQFTGGSPGINLNPQSIEAARHFTPLSPDRANMAWSAHERLYIKATEMSPYLRYNNEDEIQMLPIPAPTGVGLYGAVSITKENTSESNSLGKSISFYGISLGNTTSRATSRQLNEYRDVNGDGYPDIIGNNKIQLTSKRGGLTNSSLNINMLGKITSNGSGKAAGGSAAHIVALTDPTTQKTNVKIGNSATFSGNFGGSEFITNSNHEQTLIDVNGDGLLDIVMTGGTVRLNTSGGFVPATWPGYGVARLSRTISKSISAGFGGSVSAFPETVSTINGESMVTSSNLDIAFGVTGSRSVTQDKNDFADFNGDGLPDYVDSNNRIYFNTGTRHIASDLYLSRLTESSSSSVGNIKNLGIMVPFPIPFFGIIIKAGVGGGLNKVDTFSEENVSLRDFDGDGYLDIVKSTTEKELVINYSRIARTNMLKTVNNPTGSSIELDYATKNVISGTGFGNNYKMPFKKWVLSRVQINDGFESDGEDIQKWAFEYKNGFKDRRERKFLGFGEVISHQLRKDGTVYRTSVTEYMLNSMQQHEIYLQGNASDSRKYQYIGHLPIKQTVSDAANRIWSTTDYEYSIYSLGAADSTSDFITAATPTVTYTDQSRILSLLKKNKNVITHYEGNSTNAINMENRYAFLRYDRYGNVLEHLDETMNLNSKIKYHDINNQTVYMVNIPKEHTVNAASSGTVLRKSTTELSASNNIARINKIKTLENQGQTASTDFEYNVLGNLIKVRHPKPQMNAAESSRFYQEYTYDTMFDQFITKTKDAYGYESTAEYVNFGMPLVQTDINAIPFHYTYDGQRRMVQFKGPYHKEWTIRNQYRIADNKMWYAVTQHNLSDEMGDASGEILHTSAFADGLGRIVQTKKQLEVQQTCESEPGTGYRFAVSGAVIYDEFGRTITTHLPQEQKDCTGDFNHALRNYTPLTHTEAEKTSYFYDMQDRLLQQHVYGLNATTTYEYGFGFDGTSGGAKSREKIQLPEGNISETYKDHKGRTTSVVQTDPGTGQSLATVYQYDALSQLLKVTDAENKTTSYTYDSFGQKSSTKHPDNGTTTFKYDLTGKLITTANQNLINQGQEVQYQYHFNQLRQILYPSHKVRYYYGAAGEAFNTAGRLKKITDLTGTRGMQYGALGEVIRDMRYLSDQSGELKTFDSSYRYDSWGRIMEMTYPDQEHLRYRYNEVGQLSGIYSNSGETYLKNVQYNYFDQPVRIVYGNDVVTTQEYDITQRIRAMQLDRPDESTFMRNLYNYDRNQNIVNIKNGYSQHQIIRMGGQYEKSYQYDGFNRLASAVGKWKGYQESHKYKLNMEYNRTHGIVNKNQWHVTGSPQYSGETVHSYQSKYTYQNEQHPHAPSNIRYTNFEGQYRGEVLFRYDANGNMINAINKDVRGIEWRKRDMLWDEQNRLTAVIDDDKKISHYVYDHSGERTFKSEGSVSEVSIAGENIYRVLDFNQYLLYPSGYMVVNPARDQITKHYYINGKRFASRLGRIGKWMDDTTNKRRTLSSESGDTNTAADFNQLAQANGLNLPYATYSISVGNSAANCISQLQSLLNLYNTPTTQHCRNYIQSAMNNLPACEALVLVNNYICSPVTPPNKPIDTTLPGYTPGQLQEFDCLTELNILIGEYTAILIPTPDENGRPVKNPKEACARNALYYIQTQLTFNPALNACEVYLHLQANYSCDTAPGTIEGPGTPGTLPDNWTDNGGNEGDPKEEYDESLRKPIWWYHTDHLGSSTYLTDNFGRPSHYYDNLPFGETMVEHNQSQYYGNQYKFNGKELDSTTGMYYSGARYYEPRFSIFVSVDPLAEQTMTPYQYVSNNPINFIDPTGLYRIYFMTRSYAPFRSFGPGNNWHGDNRSHSLDINASYRGASLIEYDTERRSVGVEGWKSRSFTFDGKKDKISRTSVYNRSKGNNIDVHSSAGNAAQFGAQPIDQFTKLNVKTEGNVKTDHILNIKGTISGDNFPNQESIMYDSFGNGLWLGNYETKGDRQTGPVFNLFFENEGDVSMDVNIRVKVSKDGEFLGVMQKNKRGNDEMISIRDWNKKFEK